jgi:hypothetical protein
MPLPAATPPATPTSPPPTSPPPKNRSPLLLLLGAIGAGLVLLALCVGGTLLLMNNRAQSVIGVTPAPATTPLVEATADTTGEATPVATAEPQPTNEPAPTEEPTIDTSAAATAEAAAVAERQTAIAVALATQVPTPVPTPPGLQPAPGTLTLADYQTTVSGYSQRLFETFDRGERTKAIWSQFENESVRAILRDNFYALTLKGESRNMWETWDRDLGNTYNVELAVAFETTGEPATVGLAFDVQPEGDNGVFFEVFNDKHWQLRTVQDGRLVRERSTDRIPLPELQDGVGTNVLWVVRGPEEVQLWINSVHVATVPAGPFEGGRAGVIASSREGLAGEATVIADNFRVRTP